MSCNKILLAWRENYPASWLTPAGEQTIARSSKPIATGREPYNPGHSNSRFQLKGLKAIRKLTFVGGLILPALFITRKKSLPFCQVNTSTQTAPLSNPSCLLNTKKKEKMCECSGNPLARVALSSCTQP